MSVNGLTSGMSTRLTYSINELSTALDAYADRILQARWGVTISQFTFLAVLEEGQPIDVTHLAECLGVTKAAVSKRVPVLVGKGLVQTQPDPANARRVVLTLTEAGLRLAREAGDVLESEFEDMFVDRPDLDLERIHADVLALLGTVLSKESAR